MVQRVSRLTPGANHCLGISIDGPLYGFDLGSVASAAPSAAPSPSQGAGGGWGSWGNVWSTASAAIQQARTAVDEQVKNLPANLPNNEQAKKWSEGVTQGVMGYVKQAQLDKLGQELKTASLSRLTEILNVVAPPISEHEVIQVWLSHDMEGYEGTENLVFRSLSRVDSFLS
jgi:hypothetical protein